MDLNTNPPNPSNPSNPSSPSNPPNPLSPLNPPSLPSPSHPPNPCPHPSNPRFKDSPVNLVTWIKKKEKNFESMKTPKALLAKPNPDANYFYLMRDELTKIDEYMTSFSKIARKN